MNENSGGTIDITKIPTADNSLVWYAAILPAFALFANIYAENKYHGFLLWGLVILLRIGVCIYDNKKLIKMGMWQQDKVSPTVLLPFVYIIKRTGFLKRKSTIIMVAGGCLLFGITNNGFVQTALATDETYCQYVSQYYSSYITNLPDEENFYPDDDDTIDMILKKKCYGSTYTGEEKKADVEYTSEKIDGVRYVTASATYKKEKLEIVFSLDHDGYCLKGMDIESVSLGGRDISGDEKDDLIKQLFMYETAENEEDAE